MSDGTNLPGDYPEAKCEATPLNDENLAALERLLGAMREVEDLKRQCSAKVLARFDELMKMDPVQRFNYLHSIPQDTPR